MPKPAQIIYWRKRREKRRKQQRSTWFKAILVVFLTLFALFGLTIAVSAGGIGVVIASFNQSLPDFAALEELGEDPASGVTLETLSSLLKVSAWPYGVGDSLASQSQRNM